MRPGNVHALLSAALIARGAPPEQVATENVRRRARDRARPGPATDARHTRPRAPPGTGQPVTFARSNLTVAWDTSYGNLLEFAEACDVPVSFRCRTGVCHNCESGILSGDVTYRTDPLEPPPEGRVLLCCSRPSSELAQLHL